MKIVITGANGAVGQEIVRLATPDQAPAYTIVAAVRSDRARRELPSLRDDQVVRISYDDPASLNAAFAGADAVIHLAGILVEAPGSTYQRGNVETTRRVVDAAQHTRVKKLVYISATSADARSSNGYWRSKGEAEDVVRASGCAHTILRVPLLLGRGTEGAAALQRHLKHPTVTLPGGGRNRQQPLHVGDLACAALRCAEPGVAANRTLDLIGPVSLPDREILERAAGLQGRTIRIRSMPVGLLRLLLSVRRRFTGPGFSPDVLDVITANTDLDPDPAAVTVGITLTDIDRMISESL